MKGIKIIMQHQKGDRIILQFKWSVSRARDSYGYNVCTLYADGEKVASCNGGGYDMKGTCLGNYLGARFSDRLRERIIDQHYGLTFHDPEFDPGKAEVPGTGQTVGEREVAGESLGLERYQALYAAASPLPTVRHRVPSIDGAVGLESVRRIGESIGLRFENRTFAGNDSGYLMTVEA